MYRLPVEVIKRVSRTASPLMSSEIPIYCIQFLLSGPVMGSCCSTLVSPRKKWVYPAATHTTKVARHSLTAFHLLHRRGCCQHTAQSLVVGWGEGVYGGVLLSPLHLKSHLSCSDAMLELSIRHARLLEIPSYVWISAKVSTLHVFTLMAGRGNGAISPTPLHLSPY